MNGRGLDEDGSFSDFFQKATGDKCFPFQRQFAQSYPSLVNVPTGLGKTAMVVIGWLWRRFGTNGTVFSQTPRRLVYCLPMRVLVEQTAQNANKWISNLKTSGDLTRDVSIHILMGGEDEEDWDIYPEREAIIIGTQDMLLSRALNRGYAASRARWPMQFGLLHTDSLWVFDEIQLMGSGLATTAQLEAFRRLLGQKNGNGCQSVWMSATMRPDWLKTVDFKDRVDDLPRLELNDEDHQNQEIKNRWNARKPLRKADAMMDSAAVLAGEIRKAHKPGARTIVVVNTVKRARELFDALNSAADGPPDSGRRRTRQRAGAPAAEGNTAENLPAPNIVLLHSRFRPGDRQKHVDDLLDQPPSGGTIIVSTQVIEAGVDVSAATLFTELAPWASLVQRFGRCNRRGEQNEHASAWWIDVPDNEAAPYEVEDLKKAREQLGKLQDVGLKSLNDHPVELPFHHMHVIRRKDLIDLFDTTPDLAGNDIDIDRYVRDIEETDVRVFWRNYGDPGKGATPNKAGGNESGNNESGVEAAPRRDELCPAPIGNDRNPGFRAFSKKNTGKVWRWGFLDKEWERVDAGKIVPGQVYLAHTIACGYTSERGWDGQSTDAVVPVKPPNNTKRNLPDANDDDATSWIGVWRTIADHTNDVCEELDAVLTSLPFIDGNAVALRAAARWHDRGKTHDIFVKALPDGAPQQNRQWAKAAGTWKRYERRHFRHELASALAVLQRPDDPEHLLCELSPEALNLVAYLVAAHHGKVRLSIRSMPNELRPCDKEGKPLSGCRFACGVWDGDRLPETDLGQATNGTKITAPSVTLSLEPLELGLCELSPFAGQASWTERMLRLRDSLGPFHLAYLEAILRASDMRASAKVTQKGVEHG